MHPLNDKKNNIIVYLILLIVLSTISNKTFKKEHNYSHTIIKIDVSGLSNSNNLLIKKELNSQPYKNIFFINKDNIQKIMSKYNLIENYNVQKIYPTKINIQIEPTKFIAKIQRDEKFLIG